MTQNTERKASPTGTDGLLRNMLYNTIGSLTYQCCLWLLTVLVVVLSNGFESSGVLAFAMATGNMFFAIGTYNMRAFQVSDVNVQYTSHQYIAFRLITIALAWAFVLPYTIIVSTDRVVLVSTILFLIFKTDECFADVLYGVDQIANRMDIIGVSQFVRGIAVVISFALILNFTNSLSTALLGICVVGVAVTVAFDSRRSNTFASITPSITFHEARKLILTCLPVAAAPLCASMIVSVPRQYFSTAFGLDALGSYAAIAPPAVLVQAAAKFLYLPLLVPLAEAWESGDGHSFIQKVLRILVVMIAISAVVIPVLCVAGRMLLPIVFGQEVSDYLYLFPFVLCSTALMAVLWFLMDVLVICRDTIGQLVASASAFLISLLIMAPLERSMYMNGINVTIIVSVLFGIAIALVRLVRTARPTTA